MRSAMFIVLMKGTEQLDSMLFQQMLAPIKAVFDKAFITREIVFASAVLMLTGAAIALTANKDNNNIIFFIFFPQKY